MIILHKMLRCLTGATRIYDGAIAPFAPSVVSSLIKLSFFFFNCHFEKKV